MPSFRLTYHPSVDMIRVENVELFSSEYTLCLDDVERIASAWAADLAAVASAEITDHYRAAEDVYCMVYDNGCSIWVNYSQTDAAVDGVEFPAMSYAAVWR